MKKIIKLIKYWKRKFYCGHIRWILLNKDRTSAYCYKCGNYANGAVRVNLKIGFLVIPVCKSHINEIDPEVCQAPFHVKASLDKINPK